MKKLLSLIVCISTVFSLFVVFPHAVSAETSGVCGDNLTWTLDDEGTLTISGTGEMYDFTAYYIGSSSNAPWHDRLVKKVVISDGVASIGINAFVFNTEIVYNTYKMEAIKGIGITEFLDNYNTANFKCIEIQHHKKTGQVSKIIIEQQAD